MEDVKIKMTVKLCLNVPTSVFLKVFQSKFYKIKLLVKTCVKVGGKGVYSSTCILYISVTTLQ